MTFGASLGLLALGAVLAFAVQDSLGGVNLAVVGYILMLVGVLGLVLGLVTANRARGGLRSTSRRTVIDGTQPPRQEVIEQDVI